jgi:hypothetical protein
MLQEVIAAIIVLTAALWLIRRSYRTLTAYSQTRSGSGSCGGCGGCGSRAKSPPVVSLEPPRQKVKL